MSEGLIEGAWSGRRAFVLGGGPSLSSVDPYALRNELTLGLNMAFLHDPTATLVYDLRLLERINETPAWKAYRGHKLWLNSELAGIGDGSALFEGVRILRPASINGAYPRWPRTLSDGLYRGNNAGTAGICLADVLGASPIYLLGFDMRAGAGRAPNWHEMYPEEWRASDRVLRTFRDDLARVKGFVRGRVVNLTPDSALDAFDRSTLADVLGAGP
jgi:hypothetical protein